MLTLFYSPGACSLAPHIVLEEVGLPFTLKRVMLAEGQQHSPEFRAINPRGRVPALQLEDGQILTEQLAISSYVASLYPAAGLVPADPLLAARCLEWLSWLSGTVHGNAFASIFRPARFSDDSDAQAKIATFGRGQVKMLGGEIEQRLTGRQWAIGDHYSIVDPFLLTLYRWGLRIELEMRELFPQWTAHAERILQRPAVQRALAAEGINVF